MRAGRRAVVLLAVGAALSACSLGSPGTLDSLRERTEGAGTCRPYDSLDDLLGNARYRTGEAEAKPMTVAVVTGRFTSVAPGQAFVVDGVDARGGQAVDFDAEDAVWKTVEAQFLVDHVVSGQATVGDQITVGIAFGPAIDPDRAERDLRDLGRSLLFLNKSPVFAYDSSVYGTADDGSLIANVAGDGTLSLPVRGPDKAKAMLQETPTLASIDAAAAKPGRVLLTDPSGCQVIEELADPA